MREGNDHITNPKVTRPVRPYGRKVKSRMTTDKTKRIKKDKKNKD
jgi:hypothetical protein